MWIYQQGTGEIRRNGRLIDTGYSGHGLGRDNPAMEAVPNVGPIPRGRYTISAPHDHPRVGKYALALTPVGHKACGRDGFYWHGDSISGDASHGCIVTALSTRKLVWASQDHDLEVVKEWPAGVV